MLLGNPEPRLFTEPLRPLTRETSRGFECADFADKVIGQPLLPWQKNAAIRALELNEDGSYRFRIVVILVARQNGKTHLLRTVTLWKMYCDNVRLVLGAAQNLNIAKEVWESAIDIAKGTPDLAAEVATIRYQNGEQSLALATGARYRITAATRGAGRGLSVDQLNLDEVREWHTWDAWGALSKTVMARPSSQIWVISNAGSDDSVVLNKLREAGISGSDPSICLLEWSAPEGCDLDDPDAWAAANPGLGHTVSEQAIRMSLATDPPAVFRTEVLCQHVTTMDEAISLVAWSNCSDPSGTMESLRSRVVVGVDVSPDSAHVTAVAAATTAGATRVEVIGAWSSTIAARAALPELLAKVKPAAIAWYPTGPAAALATVLRTDKSVELKGAAVNESCQQLADLVAAQRILHNGDPLLSAQISQAMRLASGDGWRFARKGGVGHVDAIYACAAAVQVAQTLPTPVGRPRIVLPRGLTPVPQGS